jgi:ribosomal protein L13
VGAFVVAQKAPDSLLSKSIQGIIPHNEFGLTPLFKSSKVISFGLISK